ncbi:microtubule-associated protein 2-like isoform X1 [Lates japonicus]|uniref:Microtubule-associated protein 2-like isoform X1 n=1 Tax=Lates japonicus TaxID=270547 RepID=A0AAD3N786_LATJO|nr:microtubule-associated protein 2-like isoform X1 [Lates japonicus]
MEEVEEAVSKTDRRSWKGRAKKEEVRLMVGDQLLEDASQAQTRHARSVRSGASTPALSSHPHTPSHACRTPGSRHPGKPHAQVLQRPGQLAYVILTPPKSPSSAQRQLKVLNQPPPDLKNVKSKIGIHFNIKNIK